MNPVQSPSKRGLQNILKLFPVVPANIAVSLPQALEPGVSAPGLRNTIQTLFEARFKQSLNDLSHKATALSAAAASMNPAHPGFNERSVRSSNPEVATISASSGSGVGSANLQVNELAEAQINTSEPLQRDAQNTFDSGRQFFDLIQEGKSSRLSVFIDPKDAQGSVLEKIAKAINNAGREVDASVISVDDGETIQLKLESHGTGEKSAFTLLDRLGTVVEKSGANNQVAAARNAEVLLNDQTLESDSNQFNIDSGRIEISLEGALGTTEISVGQDRETVKKMVTGFVSTVNQFREEISKSASVLNEEIGQTFDHQLSMIRESLESFGLRVDIGVVLGDLSTKTEAIAIDEYALDSAIEKDPDGLAKLLTGAGGLASRMGSIADAVQGSSTLELISQSQHVLSPLGPGSDRDTVTGILLNALS